MTRHPEFLDLPGQHRLGGHDGRSEISSMERVDVASRDRPHVVPSAPDPLQGAGDRCRSTDLDHPVDGTHVDAELQRTGRHHAAQLT